MASSSEKKFGRGRFHYLQSLVTEFQDTHRKGNQVMAVIHTTERGKPMIYERVLSQ